MDTKLVKSAKKRMPPNAGMGRKQGSVNKSTAMAREAIAIFVDANSHKLQQWLDEIAANEKHGPKVAFDCFMQVAEYHVPKLARVEQVGDETAPVRHEHIHKFKE
jgi:hypothetical protein